MGCGASTDCCSTSPHGDAASLPNFRQIKRIWLRYIEPRSNYFFEVHMRAIRRSESIAEILGVGKQQWENLSPEAELRLHSLSERTRTFMASIILNGPQWETLRKSCVELGKRHAEISDRTFQAVYWDVFILAMTEELESGNNGERQPSVSDIYRWQKFLRFVVEYMRTGYRIARTGILDEEDFESTC